MRRQTLLRCAVAFLALMAWVTATAWWLLRPDPPPQIAIRSTFLTFTNGAAGPAAVFLVRDYPKNAPMPNFRQIVRNKNGIWQSADIPAGAWHPMVMHYSLEIHPDVQLVMAVPTTNEAVRFVLELPRRSIGNRELVNRILTRFGRPANMPLFRERSLFFTNETTIEGQ